MKANTYRKAALLIEQHRHRDCVAGYSCLAIAKAAKGKGYTGRPSMDGFRSKDLPEVVAYKIMYGLDDSSFLEDEDHRVVALCLMAAMVETGDA